METVAVRKQRDDKKENKRKEKDMHFEKKKTR
jgi:hypothetical protein